MVFDKTKYNREYRRKNPEKYAAWKKAWRVRWAKKNPKKVKEYAKRVRTKLRGSVIEKYGSKCASCGCDDHRVLDLDHVIGGGRKLGIDNWHTYKEALTDETGKYQLLCRNCNWIKWLESLPT